jgi:hypothetical protein
MAHITKENGHTIIRDDWGLEDILSQAKDDGVKLSKKKALAVMDLIVEQFDANIGINWEVISNAINTTKE